MSKKGMGMAFIYKITNKINGKVYIGKTERDVEKRWQEHCRESKKKRCEKRPLYNAINKYGAENFSVETIEQTDRPEEREIYWIDSYDSYKHGYNATRGGDGKSYVDAELFLSLWNEGKTPSEIKEHTGHCTDTITKHLKQRGITTKEIKTRSFAFQKKRVAQIDRETGEVIQIFPSTEDAGKHIGRGSGHIRHVCIGMMRSAYGYKWEYVTEH